MKKLTTKQMIKKLQSGRYQAIVKEIAGRRMFIGIERVSRSSRKRSEKFMCAPQDLGQLVARMKREREKAAAEAPPSTPPTEDQSTQTQPSTPDSNG